jgi:hypothetical protein
MTERYAHLRPDLFSARDLATIDLDLNASEPDPGPSGPENGHDMASPRQLPGRIQLKLRRKCRSRPVSRGRFTVSDSERVEGSTALDDSGTADGGDTGDRLEGAGSSADWPRNGQVTSGQLVIPGVTPDLFLAAGETLTARADLQGLPADQVAAMRALALAQGAAAKTRP